MAWAAALLSVFQAAYPRVPRQPPSIISLTFTIFRDIWPTTLSVPARLTIADLRRGMGEWGEPGIERENEGREWFSED